MTTTNAAELGGVLNHIADYLTAKRQAASADPTLARIVVALRCRQQILQAASAGSDSVNAPGLSAPWGRVLAKARQLDARIAPALVANPLPILQETGELIWAEIVELIYLLDALYVGTSPLFVAAGIENLVYTTQRLPMHVTNPSQEYWYNRSDGPVVNPHVYGAPGTDDPYLTLTIPPCNGTCYVNSEVYNSPATSTQPKNVILNPSVVDNCSAPRGWINYLADLTLNLPCVPNGLTFAGRVRAQVLDGGSRGWGFWNTSGNPAAWQYAWFIHYQGQAPDQYPPNGFYAETVNALNGQETASGRSKSLIRLPDLDEKWHDYRIVIHPQRVEYSIDGLVVAVAEGSFVPDTPLAFHNWVDNNVWGSTAAQPFGEVWQVTPSPRSNITQWMTISAQPI